MPSMIPGESGPGRISNETSLGGWDINPTPRLTGRGTGNRENRGALTRSNSFSTNWGLTPRIGASAGLVSSVWPKAFDSGGTGVPHYESDEEELDLFAKKQRKQDVHPDYGGMSSPGFNTSLSASSPSVARLTPPLILPQHKSPIPPQEQGTHHRLHKRPPSVCSTIPFRTKTAEPPRKEYGNKFYIPDDKEYYKPVMTPTPSTVKKRPSLDDGSIQMSASLASLYTMSLYSSSSYITNGTFLNSLSSSESNKALDDSDLYVCMPLKSDKKVEHRAKMKKNMFVGGNTSYDKTGCGKMGFVEHPSKDSMFESYKLDNKASPVSRVASPVYDTKMAGKLFRIPKGLESSQEMKRAQSEGSFLRRAWGGGGRSGVGVHGSGRGREGGLAVTHLLKRAKERKDQLAAKQGLSLAGREKMQILTSFKRRKELQRLEV
ncbi:hypothetical protein TrVE_jg7614 [Triparma verrucosa]|uniref:Uncharacterized protein n=1 Tax=Triparma verrucosa TaxID=1606542 RepID=A0A9W7EY86_9STRA|nr:hypothetical protein TrVE_jg7614 [Triparma verrucosa]